MGVSKHASLKSGILMFCLCFLFSVEATQAQNPAARVMAKCLDSLPQLASLLRPPKSLEEQLTLGREFEIKSEGMVRLTSGTFMEGDFHRGGLFPMIRINVDHPKVAKLLEDLAQDLEGKSLEEQIQTVDERLNNALPMSNTFDYRRLLRSFRRYDNVLEISDFVEIGAGDERVHMLLSHFALQRLGHDPLVEAKPERRFAIATEKKYRAPRIISIEMGFEQPQSFHVLGRSAADRKFQTEAQQIRAAEFEEQVSIEWIFASPYGPLGHAGLRVGNTFYEFDSEGWVIHNSEAKNQTARSYIFNNNFIKQQYRYSKEDGAPPFLVGIPLQISRSTLDRVLATIEQDSREAPPFHILFNNCNQRVLQILRSAGVDLPAPRIFQDFSSVETLKALLRHNSQGAQLIPNIYVIGQDYGQRQNLETQYPAYMRADAPSWAEFFKLVSLKVGAGLGLYAGPTNRFRRDNGLAREWIPAVDRGLDRTPTPAVEELQPRLLPVAP